MNNDYIRPSVTGDVRWNGSTKKLEVSCGNDWLPIDNTVQLSYNHDVFSLLEWVKMKKTQEEKIAKYADQYPAIKDAKEKLDILVALVKEETK
jgi:hypothetical protein